MCSIWSAEQGAGKQAGIWRKVAGGGGAGGGIQLYLVLNTRTQYRVTFR